jgi:hypothetical protein
MRDDDVYIMQDSGKFVVQDLESRNRGKEENKKTRKEKGYGEDSDTDDDDEKTVKNKTNKKAPAQSSHDLRRLIKSAKGSSATAMLRTQVTNAISKKKSAVQLSRQKSQGHIEKFSGDAYKSTKGKGDVIKAGKLEPFSYI